MYCLPVVSNQLVTVGYDGFGVITAISLWSGVGTILLGLLTDLPFVAAPPTSISILFAGFLETSGFTYVEGNVILIISGLILIGFGYRHIGYLVARLIPLPIQVGTTVGMLVCMYTIYCMHVLNICHGATIGINTLIYM